MQIQGGYRYPGSAVCALLSVGAMGAVTVVWVKAPLPLWRGLATLLVVEGTVLWASSLTPIGLLPPPSGLRPRLGWFFGQQGGVAFTLNQPMFYSGVVLAIIGTIVGSCAG